MKKIVGIAAVIIVILFVYKMMAPDVWIGKSENEKWTAKLYQTKEGSKWVYDGDFYWRGSGVEKKNVRVTLTQYLVNGKMIAGNKKGHAAEQISDQNVPFVGMTSKPKSTDLVQAVIHWKEEGKNDAETVTLNKSVWH